MAAPIKVRIINIAFDLSKIVDFMKRKDHKEAYKHVLDDEQEYGAEKALTWANILQHRAKLA